jgi:hypothetical protein
MSETTVNFPANVITIKNGNTHELGRELHKNIKLEIAEVHVAEGEGIFFSTPRKFVPSFDLSKVDNEQIFAYANTDERIEGHDSVSVRGKALLKEGKITIEGDGFDFIVLHLHEQDPVKPE